MSDEHKLTRRGLLGSGLALGGAGLVHCGRTELPTTRPGASTLAQSYTIAATPPDDGHYYFMHDPGIALLPSGKIVVAAPFWGLPSPTARLDQPDRVGTLVTRSSDGGATWETLATLPYSDAAPFVHDDGNLYMFVEHKQFQGIALTRSEDEGRAWLDPAVPLFAGLWNASTSMVRQNGKLYWSATTGFDQASTAVVIAASLSKSLLSPDNWRMSTPASHPATPAELVARGRPASDDWWLEPNVVSVGGKVRVILRTILDGYATTSLPIVCDLTESASGMALDFTQFFPAPGGQCKCFILRDDESRLFWMLSNLAADSHGTVFDWSKVYAAGRFAWPNNPGNDRRFLMLSYSVDALNWFPAGCVAQAALLRQSFMYPSAAIDGDDLILISRTSVNGQNQHNADLVTFHRIAGFRSAALNLYPADG